jgi:hypothetical protein
MATTGGKAYLMVLQDILDLVESPEYSSHPKQQPGIGCLFCASSRLWARISGGNLLSVWVRGEYQLMSFGRKNIKMGREKRGKCEIRKKDERR